MLQADPDPVPDRPGPGHTVEQDVSRLQQAGGRWIAAAPGIQRGQRQQRIDPADRRVQGRSGQTTRSGLVNVTWRPFTSRVTSGAMVSW